MELLTEMPAYYIYFTSILFVSKPAWSRLSEAPAAQGFLSHGSYV